MSNSINGGEDESSHDIQARRNIQPSPETLTKLLKRVRLLTLELLPVEVDPSGLEDAASRVVTPEVIAAYTAAAGDFIEAMPYCLLRARKQFKWDANHSLADYGENYGRAIACEVLARRIMHQAPREQLTYMMSNRFQTVDWDGDNSELTSALEIAIDTHCTIFLSSNESQDVVNALWRGDLVTKYRTQHNVDYVSYHESRSPTFWGHLDPSRMSVPRYQNLFRILVWLIFLGVYSQAVREPLDPANPLHQHLDPFEVVLYFMALAFSMEDLHKLWKLLQLVTIRSFSFWLIVSACTDCLLITTFSLRIAGILHTDTTRQAALRLKAFQVLSFVAPLIWMKLITVFDGYKYVGTMQICIARMMRESGIFFALLSILGVGFVQGLYALDAADGESHSAMHAVNLLIQALLQSPAYDQFDVSPAGLSLYYLWNVATAVILLNVLVSLFSSAYSEIVEDAEAEYLAYFAGKTVELVRAPDSFVYPAPANTIEVFLVAPFEVVLSDKNYAKLNRYVMLVLFFIPLTLIAFYESVVEANRSRWVQHYFGRADESEDDSPATRDPAPAQADSARGLKISRVPFTQLVKVFPNSALSSEATILKEVRDVKGQLEKLMERLDEIQRTKKE